MNSSNQPTPRTNAEIKSEPCTQFEQLFIDRSVSAQFARTLERELASESKWAKEYLARAERAEAECLEQARLLGMSGEREADLLGKIFRLQSIIDRASIQFFHEGTDGETAAKTLNVLNESK